jgi:hypothetical protein
MEEALISIALSRGWQHKYAKFARSGSQSLFVHAINVFSVARILGRELFKLTEDDQTVACLAGFLHDLQKENDAWQTSAVAFMRGERGTHLDFSHDSGTDENRELVTKIIEELETRLKGTSFNIPSLPERILNIIVNTHDTENQAQAIRRKAEVGPIDPLTSVVRLADSIASIKEPKEILRVEKDPDLIARHKIQFEYHEIGAIRGIVSSFLNEAAIELMKEAGYTPLLHFGNGCVYVMIGDGQSIAHPRQRLLDLFDDQFESFRETDVYESGMRNAMLGPYTQTKWPCAHIVRPEDVSDLVQFISNQPGANRKEGTGSDLQDRMLSHSDKTKLASNKESLSRFFAATGSEPDAILTAALSDFYVLVYFADFIKKYAEFAKQAEVLDEFTSDVDKWVKEDIGFEGFDELSGIAQTTTDDRKLDAIQSLWKLDSDRIHLDADRRTKIVNSFVGVMRRTVTKYSKYSPRPISDSAKNSLILDIHHIPLSIIEPPEVRDTAKGIHERYTRGKDSRSRICNLCGAMGSEDAPAILFGDGSQKFSNFLLGGSKIGQGRKAQVCEVCTVEATLRAFFFDSSPEITLVIIPDLSLSGELYHQWAIAVSEFVRTEKAGLSIGRSWNMVDIYEEILHGSNLSNGEELVNLLRPTKTRIDNLAKHLSEQRSDPLKVRFEVISAAPTKPSYESIARAHLKGDIKIDAMIMEGYNPPVRTQSSTILTPSHMFIFLASKLKEDRERKESESTSAIRTLLMALILADVYHARIIAMEGFTPIADFTLKGVTRIEMPAPAKGGLRNLGIGETIRIHEKPDALRQLAAAALIATRYVEGLGKDRLLRVLSMNRGAILRRAQVEEGSKFRGSRVQRLMDYLDRMPEIGVDSYL